MHPYPLFTSNTPLIPRRQTGPPPASYRGGRAAPVPGAGSGGPPALPAAADAGSGSAEPRSRPLGETEIPGDEAGARREWGGRGGDIHGDGEAVELIDVGCWRKETGGELSCLVGNSSHTTSSVW